MATDQDVFLRRRLQSTPGFVDFVVVVGLALFLWWLLRILIRMSENWRKMMKQRIVHAMEIRKLVKDPFRNENGYSWDYVIIFQVHDKSFKPSKFHKEFNMKSIITRLADAGLQTKMFYSVQNDEVYCKIRAPLKRLLIEADRINYKLQLEPAQLANKLREGSSNWKPVEVPATSLETSIDPYDYIYCDYDTKNDNLLFRKWPNNSVLRGVDRLKLIATIVAAKQGNGGCFLDVHKLIKWKCIMTFFPLHDLVELRELEEKWLRLCQPPWLQHVDVVKDYFGEKIGLSFLWLGHYTTWLLSAAILGFFAWINVAAEDNKPSAVIIPYFAAFIAIWSTLFLEFWKRKENITSMRWGTVGFESEEQDRPEFKGIQGISPVTGNSMHYFPSDQFAFRVTVSVTIISTLILIVIGIVIGIFVLRIFMSQSRQFTVSGINLASIIAAIINAVQIQVLNFLYGSIAIFLTSYENHRTDTAYEDALIAKTFIFQFVNSFASLFYVAFVKPFIPLLDPCVDNCMVELQTSLGTIFLTRLATSSLLKVLIPYILQKQKAKSEVKGLSDEEIDDLTEVEKAYTQAEYHVLLGTFADYAEMVIQFGYATMFIAAYPLATGMAFINNYVMLRINAWKLCQLCRRPEPRTVEDIGTWYLILEVISISAVLVNSGLIAFTGTFLINYTWPGRVWIFICMSAGILVTKYIVAVYVPDVPLEVEIQLKRQEFYLDKIVRNIADEDDSALTEGIKADINYTIRY